jgi:hypothetical protein
MFENKGLAKAVLDLFMEYGEKLEKSAQLAKGNCGSLDEYLTYKNEIDHLKNRMLKGVITPIIKRCPDLKPVGHKRRIKER